MKKKHLLKVLVVIMCLGEIAQAGTWTATSLHPAAAGWSMSYAVSDTQQVGWTQYEGMQRFACLWNGTANNLVNLNPAGATMSEARAIYGSQQAGYAQISGYDHASLWSGTADSWIDLNPQTASYSYVYGMSANQQVGYATFGTYPNYYHRCGMWTGSADSWVDLVPTNIYKGIEIPESYVVATDGVQQVGYINMRYSDYDSPCGCPLLNGMHAGLWRGTADSWVDLNPTLLTGQIIRDSCALGVSDNQQVGSVMVGSFWHASMWTGSPQSWVDLNPIGSPESYAFAVSQDKQVGVAAVDGVAHAGMWSGTAESFIDLHSYLIPGLYRDSYAYGITVSGSEISIIGWATNAFTGRFEAILWHFSKNAPTATIIAPNSTTPNSVKTSIVFSGSFTDPDTTDTHTAVWTITGGAQPVTVPATVTESNGSGSVSDTVNFAALGLGAGIYDITLTITDNDGSTGSAGSSVIVYDASAGFVAGAGWINSPSGAYAANPALTGKATFEFACKYLRGASIPTTVTEFQFKAARMLLHVRSCEWLIISGARFQYKGSGTMNGSGSYGFMLTGIDGRINHTGVDKFRLKIWNKANGAIVYDNQMGASDQEDPTTPISFGSIVIRK